MPTREPPGRLSGPTDHARFILFEFVKEAPGNLSIDTIDVRYRAADGEQHQPLTVAFDVREDKQP